MLFRLVATALVIGWATHASAKAAWEISPKWLCVESELTSCDRSEGCRKGTAQAVIEVDFDAMTITNFSGGTSRIGVKRYTPSIGPKDVPESYFASDAGQMWVIVDEPLKDFAPIPQSYPVQGVTLRGANGATLYYGECRPR